MNIEKFIDRLVPTLISACEGYDVTLKVTGEISVEAILMMDDEGMGISLQVGKDLIDDYTATEEQISQWLTYAIYKGGSLTVRVEACPFQEETKVNFNSQQFKSDQKCACVGDVKHFRPLRMRKDGSVRFSTTCPDCKTSMIFTSDRAYHEPSKISTMESALIQMRIDKQEKDAKLKEEKILQQTEDDQAM